MRNLLLANVYPVMARICDNHRSWPETSRHCRFCNSGLSEDVEHFLTVCRTFEPERLKAFSKLSHVLNGGDLGSFRSDQVVADLSPAQRGKMLEYLLSDLAIPNQLSETSKRQFRLVVLSYLKIVCRLRDAGWSLITAPGNPWRIREEFQPAIA